MKFKIVNKDNYNELYAIHYSEEKAYEWIDKYGDSKIFYDKSLRKDSFVVMPYNP